MIRYSGAPQKCPDVFVEITHPHSLPAGANFTIYHLFTLTVSKAIKIICKTEQTQLQQADIYLLPRSCWDSESKQDFPTLLFIVKLIYLTCLNTKFSGKS